MFSCNRLTTFKTERRTVRHIPSPFTKKKKNWFCKVCPYSCYTKQAFILHIRIHTGKKPSNAETVLPDFATFQIYEDTTKKTVYHNYW